MVTTVRSHVDRREGVRVFEPGGLALCQTGTTRREYRIANASAGGIAMEGALIAPGTAVSLKIQWPLIGSARAEGLVCRASELHAKVAVRYTDHQGVAELIESLEEVARLREREAVPLLCGCSDEMRRVAEELEGLGLRYTWVKRPISALCMLKDPWHPVTTIVIPSSSHWLVFSGLLGKNNPSLRRLLVDGGLSPEGVEMAIVHSIVDDSLVRARAAEGLYGALGIAVSDEDCLSCSAPLSMGSMHFCAACLERSSTLGPQDDLGGCG